MLTLTLDERKKAIHILLKKEGLSLARISVDEIAKTWEAQSLVPYPEIRMIQFVTSILIRSLGPDRGLSVISFLPILSSAFKTWIFSLIGMGSHEN